MKNIYEKSLTEMAKCASGARTETRKATIDVQPLTHC